MWKPSQDDDLCRDLTQILRRHEAADSRITGVLQRLLSCTSVDEEGASRRLLLLANAVGEAGLRELEAEIREYFRMRDRGGPARPSGIRDADRMVGASPQMMDLRDCIQRISATDTNVLITGETGTGKELVAELIQANSHRRCKPFIRFNCAAIPDTLLESELFGYERGAFTGAHALRTGQMELADGGTMFFDEIGDMSPFAQAKILRAIESKEIQRLGGNRNWRVDIRIIAATNRDLENADAFRRDLYYRLNVARVHLAPLRDRKADIPLLIRHHIRTLNRQFGREVEGLEESALSLLLGYSWPGNVRELKNLLESLFVHLPPGPVRWMPIPETVRQKLIGMNAMPPSEQELLLEALWSTNWNKSQAARRLHWSRMTLYRKMAKYRLAAGREMSHQGA